MQSDPLLFVYRLPFEGKPQPYELIFNLTKLQAMVALYSSIFVADDDVALAVIVPRVALPKFILRDVVGAWVKAEGAFRTATARVLVIEEGEPLPSSRGVVELDPADPPNARQLFSAYRDNTPHQLGAYEFERGTDRYDPLFISLARGFGMASFGSTKPHEFLEKATYILDPANKIGSVLDAGCGAGYLLEMLRRLAARSGQNLPMYAGIDAGRSQILRAQERFPRDFFRVGDVAELEFADGSFDVVCAYSVLQFLPRERISKALREILRVARRGAFVTLTCERSDHRVVCGGQFKRRILDHGELTTISLGDFSEISDLLSATKIVSSKVTEVVFVRDAEGNIRRYAEGENGYADALADILKSDAGDDGPFVCPDDGPAAWQATFVEIVPADFTDRSGAFADIDFEEPLYFSQLGSNDTDATA